MAPRKRRRFYVEATIKALVGIEVIANTLDEACEKAKDMALGDFVEILGDHNDSDFEVTGVYKTGGLTE